MADEKLLLGTLRRLFEQNPKCDEHTHNKRFGGYTVDNSIGHKATAQSLAQAIEKFLDTAKTPRQFAGTEERAAWQSTNNGSDERMLLAEAGAGRAN